MIDFLRRLRAMLAVVSLLAACSKPALEAPGVATPGVATPEPASASAAAEPLKLSPAQSEALGITLTAAQSAPLTTETEGFGTVIPHDAIAQAVAETATARAAARQSEAALARSKRLAGTAGADSAETGELAQRQAETDRAALQLAQRKLTTILGQSMPWPPSEVARTLDDVATGRRKIVRATFPLGARLTATPVSLRLRRLDAGSAEETWNAKPVWPAPADASVPGRSFFALVNAADLGEGERVLVYAPGVATPGVATPGVATPGVATQGVAMPAVGATGAWVPASAAVLSEGQYWAFVEHGPGEFRRVPLEVSRPSREGYVVSDGIHPGDRVVTAGAGLLLAREKNSGAAAE